jgi:tRNA pseudouridine13 synthase
VRPVRLRLGALPVPVQLSDGFRTAIQSLTIPLPAARWPFDPAAPWAGAARAVLAEERLEWEDLKLQGLRKPFFPRGERAAWCVPNGLTAEADPDDRHPGRSLVRLAFDLPRGSYATIVIKRIMM